MKDTHQKHQNKTKDSESETLEADADQLHLPVLPMAVLSYLNPKEGESYLDLTAGYGGHADAVLGRTLGFNHAFLVDRDQNAIVHLQKKYRGKGITILHQDFLSALQRLKKEGTQFDMVLADLGVSSPHLDDMSRGFSYKGGPDSPLDMRMDQRQATSAETLVNTASEAELTDIIRHYGEEPLARRIARQIVADRPLQNVDDLVSSIEKAYGMRAYKSRTHPATRTFQALRIAVNDELELLKKSLPLMIDVLKPGGRIVVISFHSLEDRIVKQMLNNLAGDRYDAVLHLLTKQPVTADESEIVFNPRARSAKLRAAVKK